MASSAKKESSANNLIKSKERVRDLAEVYTAEREVRAMLDLVQPGIDELAHKKSPSGDDYPDYFNATFLEPACGNGNFLIEILRRKLHANPTTRPYFERNAEGRLIPFPKGGKAEEVVLLAIQAVSTIYGFDICPNNIAETQARLYAYILYGEDLLLPGFITGSDLHTQAYIEAVTPDHVLPLAADYEACLFRFAEKMARIRKTHDRADTISPLLREMLKLVLAKNFQQGDFLAQQNAVGQPLIVGKWTFLSGKIRREDFLLADVGTDNSKPIRVLPLRSLTDFLKGARNA